MPTRIWQAPPAHGLRACGEPAWSQRKAKSPVFGLSAPGRKAQGEWARRAFGVAWLGSLGRGAALAAADVVWAGRGAGAGRTVMIGQVPGSGRRAAGEGWGGARSRIVKLATCRLACSEAASGMRRNSALRPSQRQERRSRRLGVWLDRRNVAGKLKSGTGRRGATRARSPLRPVVRRWLVCSVRQEKVWISRQATHTIGASRHMIGLEALHRFLAHSRTDGG